MYTVHFLPYSNDHIIYRVFSKGTACVIGGKKEEFSGGSLISILHFEVIYFNY